MLISKRSPLTGIETTRDIPVTQAQLDSWRRGELIQKAMPNISADDREFILTGYTPEDWDYLWGEEE